MNENQNYSPTQKGWAKLRNKLYSYLIPGCHKYRNWVALEVSQSGSSTFINGVPPKNFIQWEYEIQNWWNLWSVDRTRGGEWTRLFGWTSP